jgi:hypothetical protein
LILLDQLTLSRSDKMSFDAAGGAKAIRQWMKAQGIVGRVRSENYSMGSSINVYLANPNPEVVANVKAFADDYKYGDFDGMDDSYNYRADRPELPQAKYVFVNSEFDDVILQRAWMWICQYYQLDGAPADYDQACNWRSERFCEYGSTLARRALNGSIPGFWAMYEAEAAQVAELAEAA